MNVLAAITLADLGRLIIACLLLMALSAGLLILTGCKIPGRKPPIAALNPVRPHTFVDENGLHSWGFLARNGVDVHVSDRSFADRADLVAHYALVRDIMGHADAPTTITRRSDAKFYWSLFNEPTGQRLEVSDQGFATANACRENYADLCRAVLDCPPMDLATINLP
jgi:hypothetical protein